ncbi:MAG: hypothetical protein JHC74_09190 [Thermoleophilia bacterium]|nr:hypothetical protein [Thermoleophilia bacterium]
MSSPSPPAPPPSPAGDGARSRARAELLWYMRHADALARWPVIAEPWAQRIERRRLERTGEDITAATFSMGGR